MKRSFSAILIVALMLNACGSASAALITYSDMTSWNAAVSNVVSVTTPDVTTDPYFTFFGQGDATYSYGGLGFSTSSAISDGYFFNIGTALTGGSEAVLSSQTASTGNANILISFGAEIHGFAFNYGTFYGSDVTFTLSNGHQITQPSSGGVTYEIPDFVGVGTGHVARLCS
jgi:hypothetical protein